MGYWWLLYMHVTLLRFGAALEPYTEHGGGILRQSSPTLYRGGVIQYPDPEMEMNSVNQQYYKTFDIYTYEGWETTFTVERSRLHDQIRDHVSFTEIVRQAVGPVIRTVLHQMHNESQGQQFVTTTQQLQVQLYFWSSLERDVRVRWISKPINRDVHWGYIQRDDYQEFQKWPYPKVDGVLLNLVHGGGSTWSFTSGGMSVKLSEGIQIVRNLSLTTNDSVQLTPSDPQVSADFLLEWFPHIEGNHVKDDFSGCLSYIDQEPLEQPSTWTLKDGTSTDAFKGSSLEISFYNVTAHTPDEFTLELWVDNELYLISKHSIVSKAVYNIPISAESDVSLTVSSKASFTLLLCYAPSEVSTFSATGYLRSDGYPAPILSSHPDKTEGFPLPLEWSLVATMETLYLDPYRAWLDLTLYNSGSKTTFLQSYTGDQHGLSLETHLKYNRYPVTLHTWQDFFTDFGVGPRRVKHNELVARFQSMLGTSSIHKRFDGYSIKLEARLQMVDEGKGTVYHSGVSGTISSSRPYYTSNTQYYDITVLDTHLYNAIEIVFEDSYLENGVDFITVWSHETEGKLIPAVGIDGLTGNLTGTVLECKLTRLTLKFESDLCKEYYQGFSLQWKAVWRDDVTSSTISTPTNTTTTSVLPSHRASTERRESSTERRESKEFRTTAIGIIVVLSVIIAVLISLLVASAIQIINYRKQLSDVQSEGIFRPKYIVSGEKGKICD